MSANLRKILVKLKQKLNNNPDKTMKIQRGPMKGIQWLLAISDPNYLLGEYEKGQTELILDKMKTANGFADFGANSGYYSMLVQKHFPEAKLYLFEPLPKNATIIRKHFSKNFEKPSFQLDEVAVGDKTGQIEFTDSGNDSANTYKKESSMQKYGSKIQVEITTLDAIAEKYGWDRDILIKVDIEGAEADFLVGGETYLKQYRPTMIFATHDAHVPGVEQKCIDLLLSYGYDYKKIKDDKITGQADYLFYAQ